MTTSRAVDTIVGFTAPLAGVLVSLQQVETILSISSLSVGLTVGLIGLVRSLRKPK